MKTPQKNMPNLAKALGLKTEVWFKFENKHHLGSHKGRSLPIMIQKKIENGASSFVISSSGNAALAALRTIAGHNKNKPNSILTLKIYVGEGITNEKLIILKNEATDKINIEQVKNPKQSALIFSKENSAVLLRASNDPTALIGYSELSEELSKIENLKAVFLAVSSGTSAEGIFLGFNSAGLQPQIHIVQTENCHPLVNDYLETQNKPIIESKKDKGLADAIVDQVGLRKESISKILNKTGGDAWIANDDQISEIISLVKKETGENISPNSALAVAGLKLAIQSGFEWTGPVVCIIGGN